MKKQGIQDTNSFLRKRHSSEETRDPGHKQFEKVGGLLKVGFINIEGLTSKL